MNNQEYASCLDVELTKTSKLQEELYGENGDPDNPETWPEVRSIFYWEYVRKARSGHIPLRMTRKPVSDDYSFEVDNNHFNYLVGSELWQVLPEIRVADKFKEQVQVCWPSNIGLNIVRRATFSTETSSIQSMDYVWINMYSQHFLTLDREHFFEMIGNVPELTQWSTQLPSYTLTVPQCWDYCRDYGRAFPIGLAHDDHFTHLYKMRKKISSLLRIRVKQGENWVETRLPACRFKDKVLIGLDTDAELPPPELYGFYAKTVASELEWRKEQHNTFYTHDVVEIPDELRYEAGKKFQISLDVESASTAIFFVAEPAKALDSNNYSNFTDNPVDISKGHNPFSKVSLLYGRLQRIPEISSLYSSRTAPARFFPAVPYHKGYNVLPIGFSPDSIDTDVTATLKDLGAKLVLELNAIQEREEEEEKGEEILIKSTSETEQGKGPFYDIHVRLLVYRKISFVNNRCVVDNING